MRIYYRTHFDAAHHLPDYDGPCGRVHGHRWEVELCVEGTPSEKTGFIVDFRELKRLTDELLPDHRDLNDHFPNPTAENLARALFIVFEPKVYGLADHIFLAKIRVWESPDASAEYP